MSTTPQPDPRETGRDRLPTRRLTRLQQLTLTTWRHASTRVGRHVAPNDILAHVAMHAVVAVLRDTTDPLELRNATAHRPWRRLAVVSIDRGSLETLLEWPLCPNCETSQGATLLQFVRLKLT